MLLDATSGLFFEHFEKKTQGLILNCDNYKKLLTIIFKTKKLRKSDDALENILKESIFMGHSNTFIYSEMSKSLSVQKEMSLTFQVRYLSLPLNRSFLSYLWTTQTKDSDISY